MDLEHEDTRDNNCKMPTNDHIHIENAIEMGVAPKVFGGRVPSAGGGWELCVCVCVRSRVNCT